MEDLLKEMGQRIYILRKEKRLTQEELASLAGVGTQTISTAELGKKTLCPENIVKLSQTLNVSTDYLLTGNRNSIDYMVINTRLNGLNQKQYDRIMRVIESILCPEKCFFANSFPSSCAFAAVNPSSRSFGSKLRI